MQTSFRFAIILAILAAPSIPAQSSHTVTAAMVDKWMTELSNWGRWGADDQMASST